MSNDVALIDQPQGAFYLSPSPFAPPLLAFLSLPCATCKSTLSIIVCASIIVLTWETIHIVIISCNSSMNATNLLACYMEGILNNRP